MDSILTYNRRKYQSLSIPGRPVFVVNVYDPLSFDIDLALSESEVRMIPEGIYSSLYWYKESHDSNLIFEGRTFRFRLVGITLRKDVKISMNEMYKLHKYTWSLIHSCDNWVLATVVGVDTYNRFLGTIFCPKLGDLAKHLETKFPHLIEKYVSNNNHNSNTSNNHSNTSNNHSNTSNNLSSGNNFSNHTSNTSNNHNSNYKRET